MIAAVEWYSFWTAITNHLWLATLVVCTLAGIDRWLLRGASAKRQCLLWSVALAALCIPATLVAAIFESLAAAWIRPLVTIASPAAAGESPTILRPDLLLAAAAVEGQAWLWLLLTILWAGGAALLTVALIWRDRAATGTAVSMNGALRARLAEAAEAAGLTTDRILVLENIGAPHARGTLRPTIVLPIRLLERLETEELAAVLVHENAHLRRHDPLRRVLYRGALVGWWFFPLTWLVLRRLNRATEMACDETVIHAGFAPTTYARAIAGTLEMSIGPQPVTGAALVGAPGRDIRARLQRIRRPNREENMPRTTLAFTMVIAVITAAVIFAPPATGLSALARQSAPAEGYAKSGQSERLLDLRGVGTELKNAGMSGTLRETFAHLAGVGGFRVKLEGFDPDWLRDKEITWHVNNVTIGRVLIDLGRVHGLRYEVASHRQLVVRPGYDEQQDRAERIAVLQRYRPDEIRTVGRDLQAPKRVHHVMPQYPELARQARVEGRVLLEVTVSATGVVEDVRVLRGRGLELDEAAVQAVRQWRYTPTLVNGEAVPILLTVTVSFSLSE